KWSSRSTWEVADEIQVRVAANGCSRFRFVLVRPDRSHRNSGRNSGGPIHPGNFQGDRRSEESRALSGFSAEVFVEPCCGGFRQLADFAVLPEWRRSSESS